MASAWGSSWGSSWGEAWGPVGGVTNSIARPSSDVAAGTWLPSSGGVLWDMLDEVTPNSSDYIYTTTLSSTAILGLSPTTFPGGTRQKLRFRGSSSSGNSVTVALKDGATTIKSVTQPLTAVDREYSILLSSSEIAAITSGTLTLQLTAV